jgi:glyoxylase-like metal-dependent hydrolase (beta-lactamase superfamily II)
MMSRQFKIGTLVCVAMVASIVGVVLPRRAFAQASDQLEVLRVQNNVYAIFGAGGNITVQVGDQGPVLVDAGLAGTSEVIAAVKTISDKPIRAVIDARSPGARRRQPGSFDGRWFRQRWNHRRGRRDAIIYAHENVLLRMSGTLVKEKPLDSALWRRIRSSTEEELFVNGEAIEILYQPAAHTDGDAVVFFRRSDVVSTGDIFVMDSFPMIDRARESTIDGLIAALNTLLDIVIPAPLRNEAR